MPTRRSSQMPSNPADDELRSGSQFSLGGVMAVLAVLALVFSIVSRAALLGSPQDWCMVVLSFGMLNETLRWTRSTLAPFALVRLYSLVPHLPPVVLIIPVATICA